MTAKEFAALLPEMFSPAQLAWIRHKTSLGPSAQQVVRRAVAEAIKRERNLAIWQVTNEPWDDEIRQLIYPTRPRG